MMSNIRQMKIDNNACTHLKNMKVRVFIFAVFKKALDCKIIEKPLHEMIPEHIAMLVGETESESSFAPRVTSMIP